MNLSFYFILFLIYSIIGWIMEVCFSLITKGKLVNRGFLVGPYCPIYGTGAILATLFLNRFLDSPVILFILSVVICSVVEYLGSFLLEKIFHASWWDYSNNKFNINGRICLQFMLAFGVGCTAVMYVTNPLLTKLISYIPENILNILAIVLFVIFISDAILSFVIIWKFRTISEDAKRDSTEKVTEYVKNRILSSGKSLHKRVIKAFPKLKIIKYRKMK